MVFWKNVPICINNSNIFTDLQFKKENIPFPFEAHVADNIVTIKEIKNFIKINFGGQHKPVLDIPEEKLYGEKDIILYVKNINIIGCIRYHYIGIFVDKEIYCVDCFCIHPLWRKRGVGDYLLTTLHIYCNRKNIPHSLFLKEGIHLPIIHEPFYSGLYVYRKTENRANHIISLTTKNAYKLIDIFCTFNPIFIIKNITADQSWKLYQNGIYKVLACIQDTYQYVDGKKMGWITGWIESPITDEHREEALRQITDSMYGTFDYIWGNKKWAGNSKEWKLDGQFHWYLYQWTTSIRIDNSYCILN